MKFDLKSILSIFVWNGLIGAAVFLPAFLIALSVETVLRAGAPGGGFLYQLSAAIYVYVGMVVPVVLASLVYTLIALLIPTGWLKTRQRLIAVVLSPLVPATIIALNLSGAHFLLVFYSTVVATLAYGMSARVRGRMGE